MNELGNLGQLNGSAEQKIQQLWQQIETLRDDVEDELRNLKRIVEAQAATIADQKSEIQALAARATALETQAADLDARVTALEEAE